MHARLCRIDADQISVIYNGVDAARASSPRDEPPVILFAGRLTEQKNPLLLLQAFRRLPSKLQQKCEVHFAGEGPLQFPLEEELKNGQLSDCVKLLGHRLDIAALMQRATVLVLPSKWEGLPNVVLEAMAAGLPVIATAVDGIQELLEDGVTGWLVPSDDEAALSEAIQEALTAPETRRQRATAAQVVAAEQFKWELVVSKYDQLLTSLRQD